MKFTGNADYYIKKLDKIIIGLARDMKISGAALKDFSIQTLINKIDYGSLAGGIISPTFSLLGSVLLMIFFLIFITSGHSSVYKAIERTYLERFSTLSLKKMQRQIGKIQDGEPLAESEAKEIESIKKYAQDKLHKTFQSIPEQIQKYLLTKVLLNAGAGLTIGLMLAIFGIDFAQIWGFSIFFLNFIPTIGSAIALALPVLMTLIQTESVSFALLILGLIAGLQTVFFNVLEPMILGKRLNLNPIIILLSVLIWGYLWGIVGMLLAVPITAIIKIVISNFNSPNMKFISDLMDDQ
jgi:predicted PurR-regulated permease PerM